jgi:hypothetical protein
LFQIVTYLTAAAPAASKEVLNMAKNNAFQTIKYLLNRTPDTNVSLRNPGVEIPESKKAGRVKHPASTLYSLNTETWNVINDTMFRKQTHAAVSGQCKKNTDILTTILAIGLTIVVPILFVIASDLLSFITKYNSYAGLFKR